MAGLPDGLVKQGLVAKVLVSAMHSGRVCYAKCLWLVSEAYEEIMTGPPDGLCILK
jgi:hypothetical protein